MYHEPYSIKMRASRRERGRELHVSGAERIVPRENLESVCTRLLGRALRHSKGAAEFIHVKIQRVPPEEILVIDALPVTTLEAETARAGQQLLHDLMVQAHIPHPTQVLSRMGETWGMRGAMLLHADTLERLEPDHSRGIRATCMDAMDDETDPICKNHFREALVLASKVAHHPNIVGELCISDDPDYMTGYFACKGLGYVRITKLKEPGCPDGGRIFLFRGSPAQAQDCIRYLQEQAVLVRMKGGAEHG